jgi:hypothetical protein
MGGGGERWSPVTCVHGIKDDEDESSRGQDSVSFHAFSDAIFVELPYD